MSIRMRAVALVAALTALSAPAVASAAPPASKERRVLTKVHTDAVSVFYEAGVLTLATRADVDDEHGKRLDPALTLFNVEEAAKLTVPALPQYAFLGEPGADTWIAPQSNPGGALLWPGFSTEGVATGVVDRDELSFTLTKLSGPGTVDIYEVNGFGGVNRLLGDREDRTWTRLAGQHIHANWAFSARGTYVLRFGVRATIGGAPVSTTRDYTFHVGDVPAPVTTTTALQTSASEPKAGDPVTLTATVGPATAKGWVEFLDGETSLGWAAVSDGGAQLETSTLALGAHAIVARFTPEWTNDFTTSSSPPTTVTVVPDDTSGVLRIDGKPAYTTGETMRLRATGVTPSEGQKLRWSYLTDGDDHLYPLIGPGFTPAEGPAFELELSQAVDQYSFVVQLLAANGTVLKQSEPFDARVSGPSVGTGLPVSIAGFKERYAAGDYAELTAVGELPAGHRYRWITRSPLFPVSVGAESTATWRFLASSQNGFELYAQILDGDGRVVGQSAYVTLAADRHTLRIAREPRDYYRAGETLELKAELSPSDTRFTRYEWLRIKAGGTQWEPIPGANGATLRLPLTEADHNSSIYVRLLENEGDGVVASSSSLRLDVIPAGGAFYLKPLSGHYHSGGTIRLTLVADPRPENARFRWFLKRADQDAFRQLDVTESSHTLRATQALDGAKVYAQMLDGAGTVVAETEPAEIDVDDHGTGPNETITIAGAGGPYPAGAPVTLNAVVDPAVPLDRYEWWITRPGRAAERIEGATAASLTLGAEPATVIVKLVKDTGETYIESAPASLRVEQEEPVRVGGTVPSVLALQVADAPDLGTFVPGVARDYTASVAAQVTTTLRGAVLTVRDPDTVAPGRLTNGGEALAEPLQVAAGGAFAPLTAAPLGLASFPRAVSGEPLTIAFKQAIGAREPLDVGAYGKTLTFTLAATMP